MTDRIYGVSDYLDLVNQQLAALSVVVEGEVTAVSNRGHIYFDISEAGNGEKAILNCALWKFRADRLPFTLKVGEKVQVVGKANIYKPYGKFSFVVEKIMPTGEGALQKAFEQLKRDLQEKGYFAAERKKILPQYIRRVGVLTSRTGDALKDFRTHLGKFGFSLYHLDCRVEGIRAIDEIVRGIRYLNANYPELEVIVLTRGGGSLESLQAYNNLEVAEAIFTSKIPVLSAVGHENDVTIADLVADVRCSTPTAAGQHLTRHWREAQTQLRYFSQNIETQTQLLLKKLRTKLHESWLKQTTAVEALLSNKRSILSRSVTHFTQQIRWRIQSYKHTEHNFMRNYTVAADRIHQLVEKLWYLDRELNSTFQTELKGEHQQLAFLEKRLELADPRQRLQQGYSIVRDGHNAIVKDAATLQEHDTLSIQLYSGTVISTVTSIKKEPA